MAGLIVGIGAQNAFVLRQGVKREGVFIVVGICFLCDAALVMIGAEGLGAAIAASRWFSLSMAGAGVAFLTWYGIRSLRAAKNAKGLDLGSKASRKGIALTALAVSLLNPWVYIDTVGLVGGLAGRYEGTDRLICGLGAVTVSAIWFFAVGYGAGWVAPVLTKPKIWRIIDLVIGLMMLALAAGLARDGWLLLEG
jgi:L-lysine exporter family protein LysE/ArgO